MVDEVEIKIEYLNTNDTDPLKDYKNFDTNSKRTLENNKDPKKLLHVFKDIHEDNLNTKLDLYSEHQNNSNTIAWNDTIDSSGRLICKFCDLKYSTIQTLRHHIKRKHPNIHVTLKKYSLSHKRNCKNVCHICKASFEGVTDLKSHVNSSHSIKTIALSCLYCDATFKNNNKLTFHMYLKHGKVCNIFTCDVCAYRTIKKSHFIKHMTTHVPDKDIICKYCDYATNNLANLKAHELIHTNSRPFACDFNNCDYQSSSRSGLRSHRLKHFPELNMLFCDKCSYTTIYKIALKRHLDSHKRFSVREVF